MKEEIKAVIARLEKLLEDEDKPNGRWVPSNGEDYWFLGGGLCAYQNSWDDDPTDEKHHAAYSVFKTKEAAERQAKRDRMWREYWEIADRLNDGWEPDWRDLEQDKWYIFYSHSNYQIIAHCARLTAYSLPVFKTEELAEQAIEEMSDELKAWIKGR